jgi:hypothetical protein
MDKFSQWADRARSDHETDAVFQSGALAAEPCGQLFFGVVRRTVGAIGAYIERHYRDAPDQLVASVLAYAAPYEGVSAEMRAEQFTFDLAGSLTNEIQLVAPPVAGKCIYRMTVHISYEATSGAVPIVRAARARLEKDYVVAREYRFFDINVPPTTFPDTEHNVRLSGRFFGRFARRASVLCPNCFGNGSEVTMKIPKADWESGATGYALYSCNQLNGREACDVCGGSGGKYLKWYLDENPQLRRAVFKPGSGLLAK